MWLRPDNGFDQWIGLVDKVNQLIAADSLSSAVGILTVD